MSGDLIKKITTAGEWLEGRKITKDQYDRIVEHLINTNTASTKNPQTTFAPPKNPQALLQQKQPKITKAKINTLIGITVVAAGFIYAFSSPQTDNSNNKQSANITKTQKTTPEEMNKRKAIEEKERAARIKKQENNRLATVKSLKAYIQASDFKAALSVYKDTAYNLRSHERKELAALALTMVKPIPAAKIEANKLGYTLLGKLSRQAEHKKIAKEYEKKALVKTLAPLNKTTDKISKTSFYKHKNSPKYTSSRSTVYLYIGESNTFHYLRMKIQYEAEDWLFVTKVTAYFDGTTRPLAAGNFKRDNAAGDIWEWIDVEPSTIQLDTLKKLANAKEAILRFEGSKYRSDKTLSSADKRAIKQMLKAYTALKAY